MITIGRHHVLLNCNEDSNEPKCPAARFDEKRELTSSPAKWAQLHSMAQGAERVHSHRVSLYFLVEYHVYANSSFFSPLPSFVVEAV